MNDKTKIIVSNVNGKIHVDIEDDGSTEITPSYLMTQLILHMVMNNDEELLQNLNHNLNYYQIDPLTGKYNIH